MKALAFILFLYQRSEFNLLDPISLIYLIYLISLINLIIILNSKLFKFLLKNPRCCVIAKFHYMPKL